MRVILTLLLCSWASVVAAEEVVIGLDKSSVSITTNFAGDNIFIFGAVKRDAPSPEAPLDVIITVAGPSKPVVVRKKDRRFGIWVNTEAVTVDAAPTFYAVATSAPLNDILLKTEDLRHKVSIPRAIRLVGESDQATDVERFSDAVIRIREDQGAYKLNEGGVDFRDETLFRTTVDLPANLTEGAYETRVFLVREGAVVTSFRSAIEDRKVGLERWLFSMSRQQPLMYGIMSLAIAIFAGWGAAALFRLFRLG